MTMDLQWHDNIEISNLDIPGRHQGVVQWKFYYLRLINTFISNYEDLV